MIYLNIRYISDLFLPFPMSDSGGQVESHQGNGDSDGGGEEARVPSKIKVVYEKYKEKINRERLWKKLAKHPKFGQPCGLDSD